MNKLIRPTLGLVLLISGACNKKEADKGATSSTAETPKAAEGSAVVAPTAKPACSATAWKEPSGLFCVEATGFTASPVDTNTDDDPKSTIWFKKPGKDGAEIMFQVYWYGKRTDAKVDAVTFVSNMDTQYKNESGEDTGKLAAGKGRYYVYSRKDNAKSHKIEAITEGNKRAYWCEGSSFDAPLAAEVIAACKSVIATD